METGVVKKKRRGSASILSTVLIVLLIGFTVSSGILGFVLGKNATQGGGELIDTIVISPDDLNGSGEGSTVHFLSGRVMYASGAPCAGATVRMRGSGKIDETDDAGKFFFSDIRDGEDTVEVLDPKGDILAKTLLRLSFAQSQGASADLTVEGEADLQLPENARMLELTFTVDQEENQLTPKTETGYVVTTAGEVTNFSGKMLALEEEDLSVLPGGNIVGSTGAMLLPAQGVEITPQGQVQPVSLGEETQISGAVPQEGGSVVLETENIVIQPDGVVELPESSVGPSDAPILIENGSAQEVPELPEEYVPPVKDGENETPGELPQVTESPEPAESGPESSQESGSESGSASAPTPTPAVTPEPSPETQGEVQVNQEEEAAPADPTPTPTPGPVDISSLDTGRSWQTQSFVDLFKNRTSGEELGERDGKVVIAPGSAGYYDFELKNDADFDIRFTITIGEESFHLPMQYSIVDLHNNYTYTSPSRVSLNGKPIISNYILLPAHSSHRYRMNWEWQYEDWLSPWEDDVIDTDAARLSDRTYIVSLSMWAEEVLQSEGGTRYPAGYNGRR